MIPNIKPELRKFARSFNELRAQKANESNTVARMRNFFERVLGYDGDKEIFSETEMKGKYIDLCLKIETHICMLVEAKAAAMQLRVRQIDQAKHYASENGFRWVLLTNGVEWNLYHVTFDEDERIEYTHSPARLPVANKSSGHAVFVSGDLFPPEQGNGRP
jgi:predicted type IV restriction endonuclease